MSVDTAGAIANAMERAYREGRQEPRDGLAPATDHHDEGSIEWALIPPRPRGAFWTICLFTVSRSEGAVPKKCLVPAVTERGTEGWMLVVPGLPHEKTFGDRTIQPLMRLGLLEMTVGHPDRRIVSVRGRETWARFVARGGRYPDDLTNF